MKKGTILIEGRPLGSFTVLEDDRIVVELNGGRWDIEEVIDWADARGKVLELSVVTKDEGV